MTSESGGPDEATGETVEVHDSEGDGEVNVVDDGLSAAVRSVGVVDGTRETHLAEIDGPDDPDGEYICEDCGAEFDKAGGIGAHLGGEKKGCPEKEDDGGNDAAYDGMSEFERQGFEQAAEETAKTPQDEGAVVLELSHDEAYRVVRSAPESVARRVFDAATQEVSE